MENQSLSPGNRLRNFLKGKGYKMKDVAILLGMTRQNLNYHLSKDELDGTFLKTLLEKTGIDFTTTVSAKTIAIPPPPKPRNDLVRPLDPLGTETEHNKKGTAFTPLTSGYLMEVEVVTSRARGGYASGFADPEFLAELPKRSFTVKEIHHGTYRAFEVIGESMQYDGEYSLREGDVVLCRLIAPHLWEKHKLHISSWGAFVIHTQEGLIIKQVVEHNVTEGWIQVRSRNPNKKKYPDEKITLLENNVKEIYSVVKVEKDFS